MQVRQCAVIPFYNHADLFESVMPKLQPYPMDILIVNDASDAPNTEKLKAILSEYPEVICVTHTVNQGKGGAVLTGLKEAQRRGYTHALQVDADGQHNVTDIPRFLAHSADNPDALIAGYPQYNESVPSARKWGHSFTNFWVCLETLSGDIKDVMCGFRVYPLKTIGPVLQTSGMAKRMGFDVEIMVRAYWEGIPIMNIPTQVIYPENGISHFRVIRDNIEISWVHTRLCIGMILRLPVLIFRKLC